MRRALPNRRRSELVTIHHDGIAYSASISRFENGATAEIFIDVPKSSALSAHARDAAVAASLALQYGCPPDVLRQALTRLNDGTAAGPLGAVLDAAEAGER